MSHPLEQRVEAIWTLAHGEQRRYALARTVTAAVAATAVAAGLDYLVRFEDRGVRWIVAIAYWSAIAWAVYRYLWPALRNVHSAVDVALRLEEFFPPLRDRLASALEFLSQSEDDHLAGSAALRRGAVIDAQALSEDCDFRTAIDRRPARRAACTCTAAVGIALAFVATDLAVHVPAGRSAMSLRALARLWQPWRELAWPRANYLTIRRPLTKLARGDTFEIEVVDAFGAPLPRDVVIHYRYPTAEGDGAFDSESLQAVAGALVARKEQVERSFAYRVEGGDDRSCPWIELTVLEPPTVERLIATLHFPAYFGWPPEVTSPHVRAWRGTRVELAGEVAQPVRAATICREDGQRIPAQLIRDGRAFHLPPGDAGLAVDAPGAYWIELQSTEGVRGGQDVRYELRVLDDTPPHVVLSRPAANAFVTSGAIIPCDVTVEDDVAIHRVMLRYLRSDQSDAGYQEISLYQGSATAPARPSEAASGDQRRFTLAWDLAPLQLPPGAKLTVLGVAFDYKPQEGFSAERQLSIITAEELLDRIAERQTVILNELARLLRLQQDGRCQVDAVSVQWKHVAGLTRADVDRLQGAQLTQRQVARGLSAGVEGLPAQVAAVLADLRMNRIEQPDVARQMEDITNVLAELERTALARLERDFTTNVKQSQQAIENIDADSSATLPSGLSDGVNGIITDQDRVIAALEKLIGRLAQWDAYRRYVRDLDQLQEDHAALAQQTLELGQQTLARDPRDLAPQQRAALEDLSRKQLELARRFDNLLEGLQQATTQLAESEPLAAQSIGDALDAARRGSASGRMRSAAQSVGENQIGQAAQDQAMASQAIEAMLDALTNRHERELAGLVKKLRAAEAELAALRERQEGLRKQIEQAAQNNSDAGTQREDLERLSAQQRALAAEAERLAREMERLQAGGAARSTHSAAGEMQQSAGEARNGAGQSAAEQAARAEEALRKAERELAERRKQAEQDLARQTMARLQDALASLQERQQRVLTDTSRLETLRMESGEWSRGQLASVSDLARSQRELAAETSAAAEKLAAAKVFAHILGSAADTMQRAASRLAEQDAGPRTQADERLALKRLEQLLEALRAEPPNGDNEQQSERGSGSQQQQQGPPPADAVQRLAELKILRLLQAEINVRTMELEARRGEGGAFGPAEQREVDELSAEQSQVAEMLNELTQTADSATESESDAPPEPSLDEMLERELAPEASGP